MTQIRLARGMTVQSDRGGHYVLCVRCQWESAKYGYTVARRVARQPCPVCGSRGDDHEKVEKKPVADDRDIDKQRVEEELKKDAERAEQERPKPKVRS